MVGKCKIGIVSALALISFSLQAQTNLVVSPKSGDGILTLMGRYKLNQHSSNLDSFLDLNDLDPTDYLILEKKYKLPVKVYDYTSGTIRATIGIDDYDRALRIQKYNEQLVESGVKEKSYKEDGKLWVPFHEMMTSTVVSKPGFKSYTTKIPILGKEYEDVVVEDATLDKCVYYLVSGHGGPDPGAMTTKDGHDLCEDEYAYDVTLRLARNLISHGATVYLIVRDPDDGIRDETYLKPDRHEVTWLNQKMPVNQRARLAQRVNAINALYEKHKADAKLQRVIVTHVDSRNEGEKIDIFFYHCPGSTTGKQAADTMMNTISAKYNEHQKNRGYKGVVKARELYMLLETKPTTVYIELGNITNEFDQKRLLIPNNRQAIANWLYLGISKDASRVLKQ
ncbi:MAG: N-acetylmuramoyl-L-alanine amidase [Flavobacteriales bacterium]|nr:N-acetylmuramoyl-L-alanine amidase [Flavobacteriales bacterium]